MLVFRAFCGICLTNINSFFKIVIDCKIIFDFFDHYAEQLIFVQIDASWKQIR